MLELDGNLGMMVAKWRIFQAVEKAVQETIAEGTEEYRKELDDATKSIRFSYSETGLVDGSASRLQFSDDALRWAYAYRYVTSHTYAVTEALTQLWKLNINFSSWCDALDGHELRVCCIGGGPGSDIIAISLFAQECRLNISGICGEVLDQWAEWKDTYLRLADCFDRTRRILPGHGNVNYWHFDFNQPYSWTHQLLRIQKAEVVTMVKFVSAVSSNTAACQYHLTLLLHHMQDGAILFVMDNDVTELFELFGQAASAAGLHQIDQILHIKKSQLPLHEKNAIDKSALQLAGMKPQKGSAISAFLWQKDASKAKLSRTGDATMTSSEVQQRQQVQSSIKHISSHYQQVGASNGEKPKITSSPKVRAIVKNGKATKPKASSKSAFTDHPLSNFVAKDTSNSVCIALAVNKKRKRKSKTCYKVNALAPVVNVPNAKAKKKSSTTVSSKTSCRSTSTNSKPSPKTIPTSSAFTSSNQNKSKMASKASPSASTRLVAISNKSTKMPATASTNISSKNSSTKIKLGAEATNATKKNKTKDMSQMGHSNSKPNTLVAESKKAMASSTISTNLSPTLVKTAATRRKKKKSMPNKSAIKLITKTSKSATASTIKANSNVLRVTGASNISTFTTKVTVTQASTLCTSYDLECPSAPIKNCQPILPSTLSTMCQHEQKQTKDACTMTKVSFNASMSMQIDSFLSDARSLRMQTPKDNAGILCTGDAANVPMLSLPTQTIPSESCLPHVLKVWAQGDRCHAASGTPDVASGLVTNPLLRAISISPSEDASVTHTLLVGTCSQAAALPVSSYNSIHFRDNFVTETPTDNDVVCEPAATALGLNTTYEQKNGKLTMRKEVVETTSTLPSEVFPLKPSQSVPLSFSKTTTDCEEAAVLVSSSGHIKMETDKRPEEHTSLHCVHDEKLKSSISMPYLEVGQHTSSCSISTQNVSATEEHLWNFLVCTDASHKEAVYSPCFKGTFNTCFLLLLGGVIGIMGYKRYCHS